MVPQPRTELARVLDARLFGRDAESPAERAERVRRFAGAIGCSVQLARAILGGRRGLTEGHLASLARRRGRSEALIDAKQRAELQAAEQARKASSPRRPQGRPPSPKNAAVSLRQVEALALGAGDMETAQRVAALRDRVAPAEAG